MNKKNDVPLLQPMEAVRILPMAREHLEQVAELEQRSFAVPWSYDSFEDELTNILAHYFVAVSPEDHVMAYGGFWAVMDEANITNIAVHPDCRRMGLGRGLMLEMMCCALTMGAERMTLEVREHNRIAQALYAELGFLPEGRRRGYYSDTQEDALILWNRDMRRTLERYGCMPLPPDNPFFRENMLH